MLCMDGWMYVCMYVKCNVCYVCDVCYVCYVYVMSVCMYVCNVM